MAGDAPAGKLKTGRADGSIQNPTRGCTILQERKWRVSAILVEVRGKNGERMKRLNVKRRKILLADEHHQTSGTWNIIHLHRRRRRRSEPCGKHTRVD
jgi:hypothetical protein